SASITSAGITSASTTSASIGFGSGGGGETGAAGGRNAFGFAGKGRPESSENVPLPSTAGFAGAVGTGNGNGAVSSTEGALATSGCGAGDSTGFDATGCGSSFVTPDFGAAGC